jgi:hypothetical protein
MLTCGIKDLWDKGSSTVSAFIPLHFINLLPREGGK